MTGASPNADFAQELVALLPRLRRYAIVLTGDRHAADDLVQDTIERGWKRHAQWKPGTDLRAWLFSIMHNRRIDLMRTQRRTGDEIDDEEAVADPAPGAGEIGAIEAIDLQRAFERLSPPHRQVMLLVAVEQMSYEDAAVALDAPIGTVMSRLSRARAALRALLGETEGARDAPGGDSPRTPPPARLSRIK
ncbi:MAG: RNA polymerase sigma factor [Burkholderiaceae bacterium]|nr:RNA polymerase sigma factor [Burkholderiaceae bacterium]